MFVELPKFTKKLEDLENAMDKWIYFIKEAHSLELIPDNLKEIPQLEKALNIANQASLSVEELENIRQQEILLEDRKGELSLAKREGIEEGIEQGIEQGKIEGQRSFLLRQLERRFGQLSSSTISLIAALQSVELERLEETMWNFNTRDELVNWLGDNPITVES